MATKAAPSPGAVAPAAQAAVRRLTRWVAALTVLVVGAWVAGGLLLYWHGTASTTRHATADANEGVSGTVSVTNNGPWGEIVYIPLMISPPMEFVPDYAPFAPQEAIAWNFPNTTLPQLSALLTQIGLADELRSKLQSTAQLNPSINGLSLRPDRELVLGLSPEARAGL